MLAEDGASNGGVDIAGISSGRTAGESDVDHGLVAWCSGQEALPSGIVETRIQSTIRVDEVALWVVIELDPESIELYGLQKGHHVLAGIEGALGSSSDDVGPSRIGDQLSQRCDHPGVAFVAGYS